MYKLSRYNHVYTNDNIIYINTLTGIVFPVKKEEHKRMKKLFSDPITFELEYPTIFKQFYKWGFIIDSAEQEFNSVFYQFIDKHINDDEFCISILQEKYSPIDNQFIERLDCYINSIFASNDIKSLKIEWSGNNLLSYFDSHIHPLLIELNLICNSRNIRFNCDLNIAMSDNHTFHNKFFHNIGIPTYDLYMAILEKIYNKLEYININLQIIRANDILNESLFFSISSKSNFNIHFRAVSDMILEDNTINTICFFNKYANSYAKKRMVLLDTSYQIYSTNIKYLKKEIVGCLDVNGKIIWKKLDREKDLANPWFINKDKCRKCKFLPLLATTCCSFQFDNNILFCPIENEIIPEKKIISTFLQNTNA